MKKKHVALITIMTALSITACGGAKEADTTTEVQQPQAAVETAADVAETEKADAVTETTEADETTEAVETETEVTVSADSKFDVKFIGTCPYELSDGENVLVFSITNVSDKNISLFDTFNCGATCRYDLVFRPGETSYGTVGTVGYVPTEDVLRAELDERCGEPNGNEDVDMVLYTTEFTSDNFGDVVGSLEENREKCGQETLTMFYKNDELVGVTRGLGIEGDSICNPFDADRIVIFWCQVVDL